MQKPPMDHRGKRREQRHHRDGPAAGARNRRETPHQRRDRRRIGDDISAHDDEGHLHREGDQAPEIPNPKFSAKVDSGAAPISKAPRPRRSATAKHGEGKSVWETSARTMHSSVAPRSARSEWSTAISRGVIVFIVLSRQPRKQPQAWGGPCQKGISCPNPRYSSSEPDRPDWCLPCGSRIRRCRCASSTRGRAGQHFAGARRSGAHPRALPPDRSGPYGRRSRSPRARLEPVGFGQAPLECGFR